MSFSASPFSDVPFSSLPSSGAINTNIIPDAGLIALTGPAPSLTQPNGMTAGVGTVTLTGGVPILDLGLQPPAGTLTITGPAPTLLQPNGMTAGVGALTLTGYAPSITQAGGSIALVPDPGALTLTGYAPSISVVSGKTGGDDVPEERIEVWEYKREAKRLEKAIKREAQVVQAQSAPSMAPMSLPQPLKASAPALDWAAYVAQLEAVSRSLHEMAIELDDEEVMLLL